MTLTVCCENMSWQGMSSVHCLAQGDTYLFRKCMPIRAHPLDMNLWMLRSPGFSLHRIVWLRSRSRH